MGQLNSTLFPIKELVASRRGVNNEVFFHYAIDEIEDETVNKVVSGLEPTGNLKKN